MKKKLLTLGALAVVMSANAQSVIFYSGDNSKVFVSKDALVYTGGSFKLDAAQEKAVENKGMITIVGDYVKGTANTIDGKEFVNVYTAANDYGQVKLLSATGATDARMTTQRPAASKNYFGASYAMSFPYKDGVSYVMKSLGLAEGSFLGSCPVGTPCGNRYKMTLTKWNNNKLQHDAVLTSDSFKPGDYYNLNLREANMQAVMTGIVGYKGTPLGTEYTQKMKGIIKGQSEAAFTSQKYNYWKKLINDYNEMYETYMGRESSEDRVYKKNYYRVGNPYTSNLDLSTVDGANAWLIINNTNKTIKAATDNDEIRFQISKRRDNYNVDWSPSTGSINVTDNSAYHIASFDKTSGQWVGSAEALLLRPFETVNLHFVQLDALKLGRTRIIDATVKFNDSHKTYEHVAGAAKQSGSTLTTAKSARTANAALVATSSDNFYQTEIALLKNNALESSPVYLIGSSKHTGSGENSESLGSLFLYGINSENDIAFNSQKQFNEFNTDSYVAKPLGLGLANLNAGETYSLAFNFAEGSIFNSVKNFSDAKLYLKDNTNNKVVEVTADKTISFVAGTAEENKGRFVFYWNDTPVTLSTANTVASTSTTVYKEGTQSKLRFEDNATKASVEVYDAAGRLVLTEKSVNTAQDMVLNIAAGQSAMYVVKVTYQNGEIRTVKFVK